MLISVNSEKEPYPVAPIGAAYVAEALRERGHEVCILDLCFAESDDMALTESLKVNNPDVVGISLRNVDNLSYPKSVFYLPRVKNVVAFVKGKTSAPTVIGGSGFSLFPEEVLCYLNLEMGIIGEGEDAFAHLVDMLSEGGPLDEIQNLCRFINGKFSINSLRRCPVRYTPDRSLLDNRKYLEYGGMANIQSKRGCPFTCAYCTYPNIEGRSVRLREPLAVVDELKEMRSRYGLDYVFFVDDIFNFPEDHALLICEEMIRNEVRVEWTCFATPKGMSRDLAVFMKQAGCRGVEFGSDAGAERTLRGLGKHFTPDDIAHATELCQAVELPNAHYILIGGPGENTATFTETTTFFDILEPTAVIALIGVRIYPNTQLHDRAVEEGIIAEGSSLLEPLFYLSPELDPDTLVRLVADHASKHRNWIVPGLGIRCDAALLSKLRKMGIRGPLWDLLP